ncbi:MAG: T9SS type A sorting domain-containing protein [Bacteroidetes bacterium]|nr:T9SS type A sorting domain-containing protein [Bacteroidota bacterium]
MKKTNTLLLSIFIVINISNAQNFVQKGTDIDGEAAYDFSGTSVSMPDNHTVAIGAVANNGTGSYAGHVRIFRWNPTNGGTWLQKSTDIDGEAAYDFSGTSVSMPDSNTVAIGAIGNDGAGFNAGQVRVYRWNPANGGTWVQKGTDIDGELADDNSGYSLSMPDSNTVAIGALENDGNGSTSGHVRIYYWIPANGGIWMQKGTDIDGEVANDQSGSSVSMPDSNTVAIGATRNSGNGSSAGHVRIYRWNSANGGTWVQKGIDIDGEAVNDFSGYSISMPDSNTVAIGATGNSGNGISAGHVRIYRWNSANGGIWVQKGFDIDGEAVNDWSGRSVSMPDSNTVAIGAVKNAGNGDNAGHVRIYHWTLANGGTWVQKGFDIDGDSAQDNSGNSVSMPDSNTVAIGALFNNGNGSAAGHTRVYYFCNQTVSSFSVTACGSYTVPSGDETYTTSQTVLDTIPNQAGCDSIMTINLIINSVDTSITNTSPTLTANSTGAAYQWLDCGNSFTVISGATNQSYTATSNGIYAVAVTQNGCTDTSSCEAVNNVGVLENSFGTTLTVYPNPTSGELSIDLGSKYNNVNVIVSNLSGQVVHIQNFNNSSLLRLNIPGEVGVYFIEVSSGDKKAKLKVMKE